MGRGGFAVEGRVSQVGRGNENSMGNGKVVGVRQCQCEIAKLTTTSV